MIENSILLQTTIPLLDLSLQVAGIAAVVWIAQKIIDSIADRFLNKRFFEPIYQSIRRRYKIHKTKADPVGATFSLSFTPEEDISVSSAVDRLKTAFEQSERASSGNITIESSHWDASERSGKVQIHYSDQTEEFNIDIRLVQDTTSVREHPSGDPDQMLVGSIGMEISFHFPFNLLEDTLFNLGSLINYLESGLQDQLRGSFSGGRFIITPVNNDLTIDDWVEEEQFDISLLLASEDDRTEVEFFSDRAVVKSNQRQIDAQTVNYMRELLLNYYL